MHQARRGCPCASEVDGFENFQIMGVVISRARHLSWPFLDPERLCLACFCCAGSSLAIHHELYGQQLYLHLTSRQNSFYRPDHSITECKTVQMRCKAVTCTSHFFGLQWRTHLELTFIHAPFIEEYVCVEISCLGERGWFGKRVNEWSHISLGCEIVLH